LIYENVLNFENDFWRVIIDFEIRLEFNQIISNLNVDCHTHKGQGTISLDFTVLVQVLQNTYNSVSRPNTGKYYLDHYKSTPQYYSQNTEQYYSITNITPLVWVILYTSINTHMSKYYYYNRWTE
jgi:hypothetical protein